MNVSNKEAVVQVCKYTCAMAFLSLCICVRTFQTVKHIIIKNVWGDGMAARVVIDAGHGGWDNGAMYNGRKEKDDNLNLALAVGQILRDNGVDVVFTRTSDVYQSPREKAMLGNATDADFFISFHRNSSVEPNQYSGVQTLLFNEGDIKQEMADNINSELEKLGFQNLGRSVRTNLAVLRQTNMPAVLVETGFINTDADNALFDAKFQEMAEGIAKGILETLETEKETFHFYIQVGLFRNYDNAERLMEELSSMGYTVQIRSINGYYAVLVGEFDTMEQAKRIENVLREDGYDTLIIAM